MMINDENKKSIREMLAGRAFYLAVSACVLAAGLVAWRVGANRAIDRVLNLETTVPAESHVHVGEKTVAEPTLGFIPPETRFTPETTLPAPEVALTEPDEVSPVFENDAPTVPEKEELAFSLPLSARLGKDYSMGVPVFSSTFGDWRTHNGVDFEGEKGAEVRSVAAGTVLSVGADPLWGTVVKIDHGAGIVSSLSGLSDVRVSEGDTVEGGQVVGAVGEIPAEKNDPAHVHLELRVNGELNDPLAVMGYVSDGD